MPCSKLSIHVHVGFTRCNVLAEEDGLLLAFSAAVEKVLPPTPPPPSTPACQGCIPKVLLQDTTYAGSGKPTPDDVTSLFQLHFDGQCSLHSRDAAELISNSRIEL